MKESWRVESNGVGIALPGDNTPSLVRISSETVALLLATAGKWTRVPYGCGGYGPQARHGGVLREDGGRPC